MLGCSPGIRGWQYILREARKKFIFAGKQEMRKRTCLETKFHRIRGIHLFVLRRYTYGLFVI